MSSKLTLASSLSNERDFLSQIVRDMSDHSLKRKYAQWLLEHTDERGVFLNAVLDGWDNGSQELPENESLNKVWQRTCGITLLQQMRTGGLDSLSSLFQAARPALMINPTIAENELPIGASKFGGWPDLLVDQTWPQYKGKPCAFLGQINLAEVAKTQLAAELPASGLISFFVYCDAQSGEIPIGKVLFTSEIAGVNRRTVDIAFDEGNEIAPECELEFEETLDMPYVSLYDLDQSYADEMIGCRRAKKLGLTIDHADAYEELRQALMPEREGRSHLLGWSHPQVAGDDLIDEDSRNLLTLASEESCDWCWVDGHQLYYAISNEDLTARRFDRVTAIDG